jgi:hypothetical protein
MPPKKKTAPKSAAKVSCELIVWEGWISPLPDTEGRGPGKAGESIVWDFMLLLKSPELHEGKTHLCSLCLLDIQRSSGLTSWSPALLKLGLNTSNALSHLRGKHGDHVEIAFNLRQSAEQRNDSNDRTQSKLSDASPHASTSGAWAPGIMSLSHRHFARFIINRYAQWQ